MDKATGAAAPIWAFFHRGFDSMRTDILAIVIAIIVAFVVMKKWGQLIMMTIVATLIHLLIQAFAVPLIEKHTPALPPILDPSYLWAALSVAAFYLIALILLFFLKKNVFKMGGSGH